MPDLTPNDLSHLSDEKFNALCPQGYHAPGSTMTLSPVAQAVMIAGTMGNQNVVNDPVYQQCIAAALRALSYQCLHETPKGVHGHHARRYMLAGELRAIAAELEGKGNG